MTPKNNNNTNYIDKRISFSNVWPNKYYAEFQEVMCFCFAYIRIILNFPGFLGSCFPIDFLVFISTSLLLLFSINIPYMQAKEARVGVVFEISQ